MADQTKKHEPKEVHPFNVGVALSHMSEAYNELVWATWGFKPNDRLRLLAAIARLSLIIKNGNDDPKLKKELDELLEDYEKQYLWIQQL